MKKIFTVLFAAMALNSFAESARVTIDGLEYEVIKNDYAYVSLSDKANTIKGDVVIKNHVDIDSKTYPVTIIGDIIVEEGKKIVLPETAKEIWGRFGPGVIESFPKGIEMFLGNNFYGTKLPEEICLLSVKSIGPNTFYLAEGVRKVNIGNNLISLGANAFSITEIDEIAFDSDGQNSDFPSCVFSNWTFDLMYNIKELKLPAHNGIKLGDCIAQNCEALERVIFPDMKSIEYGYNSLISDITIIGQGVPVYGYFFKDCPKLKEIVCLGETPIEITNIDNFKEKNTWVKNTAEEFTFMDNMDECVLKVPAGSEALYREDPVWGRFQTILGFENGDYNLVSINSVEADENAEPVYYNLQGIQVKEPVKGQLYIRKAGAETTKVIL